MQTHVPAELILVDDASGDGTLEHLHRLAAGHPAGWIKVVPLSENRGAADARNAGWSASTKPYLAFLDADDAWHPRKIELQYGFMASNPDVALCGHAFCVQKPPLPSPEEVSDLRAERVSRLSLLLSNRLATPSVMLKRELPFRFKSGRRYVDDHLLWLHIHFAGLPVFRLSAPLAYVFKPMFGASGLSAQLWEMEKAELANYWILHREGRIRVPAALGLSAYSIAKFFRRILVSNMRRFGGAAM